MHISVHTWQFAHFSNLLNRLSPCQEIFLPLIFFLPFFFFSPPLALWEVSGPLLPFVSRVELSVPHTLLVTSILSLQPSPTFFFLPEVPKAISPVPQFSLLISNLPPCSLLILCLLVSYFSSRSPKEFTCWGWLNESQERALLQPEEGRKKEPCVCNIH